MTILRQFDLFAVNTVFQAKRNSSNATYIQTTAVENYESTADLGFLTDREVRTKKYQGNWIKDTVTITSNRNEQLNPAMTRTKSGLLPSRTTTP